MIQTLALIVTLFAYAILAVVFFKFIASATESPGDAPINSAKWRNGLLWAMVIVFVPVCGYTLTKMPFPTTTPTPENPVVTEVKGRQWVWDMTVDEAPVGRVVEFHVGSGDVNHGFGVYSPEHDLVTQVQAMPGFVNVLRHTFTEAGDYTILCMEYCGYGHAIMTGGFKITPQ